MFLQILGHRAELVPDAGTALDRAREGRFDVLLTDVQLPGMNAWRLGRELRTRGHLPPFAISMSAGDLGQDAVRSKEAGYDAHLIKPFKPDELEALLRRAE